MTKDNQLVIASDHRGMKLKDFITQWVTPLDDNFATRYDISVFMDQGVYDDKKKVDYPDIVKSIAETMEYHTHGILVCGSGYGVCIAANRFKHIRAATCRTVQEVEMARKHNNINVLCLGADFTSQNKAKRMVKAFFETKFEGGRHLTRVKKLSNLGD